MKRKVFVALLMIVTFHPSAFCIPEKTKVGEKIGHEYRSIRFEIQKKACEVFGYTNDVVINEFATNFTTAYKKLEQDQSADPELVKCLGLIPSFDGDNPEACPPEINRYLNQVEDGCKNKDISWVPKIRTKINDLINEHKLWCQCESNGDYSAYLEKYTKNGLFKDMAREAQDSLAAKSKPKEEESASIEVQNQNTKKDESKESAASPVDKNVEEEGGSGPVIPIVLGILIVLGGGYFIYRKKKNDSSNSEKIITPKNIGETEEKQYVSPQTLKPKEKPVDKKVIMPPHTKEPPQVASPDVKESVPITKPDCEWVLVGASVKGNGHIQSNMPCQDNHKYESLGNGWGIAVVSDGAGSAEHSELGSKVVAERGVFHFKNLVEKEGWMKNNVLPTDVEWLQKSYYTLKSIRNEVELVAQKNNVELKSLSATCLVVVYSPIGLLAAHVGDGRMGYKSASGEWRAMMTPHKGDEANQTIFLVSDFWSIPNYVMSGVLVPESVVVREPVKAFALMSDGCENTSWKCTTLNPATGKYYDQNEPFEGFFNPLEETLLTFHKDSVSEEERKAKWYKFIESGTNGFVKEQDDKTMIYGVNVNL